FTSEFGVVSSDVIPDTTWLDSYTAMDPSVDTAVERRVFRGLSNLEVADRDVITIYRRVFPLMRPSMRGAIVLNVSVRALESFVERRRTHPGQALLIYGPDGRRLFGTLPDRVIDYQISSRVSRSEWRYELYTPRSVFLAPAETMFRISAGIAVAACILGVVIALMLSLKHFAYVREALSIIDREDHGQELPDITAYSQKGFSYITYHLLRTVIKKKYLEVQLSEKALRERALELLFLRSQMNPHFLFNTLEVINWKCLDHTGGRPTEINDMISNLSAILKFALRAPSRFVSLEEEIENSRNYMVLQTHRYGAMLRDSWEIDPGALDATVIPMLIQPLLENAIYHGIRGLPDGGAVDVSARRGDGGIVIRVVDSGRGVDATHLAELRERLCVRNGVFTEHVGLINSYRRLKLAFPENSALTIRSEPDAGFTVEICLPYRRYSPEASERRNTDGEVP
ncbi:MAG: sensor histidine kinase, partial [Cytophagales bacterium]|nr:sensor histidine kinase [Cytophagales bacterium]